MNNFHILESEICKDRIIAELYYIVNLPKDIDVQNY